MAAAQAGLGITLRTFVGMPRALVPLDAAQSGLPLLPAMPLVLLAATADPTAAVARLAEILREMITERIALRDAYWIAPHTIGAFATAIKRSANFRGSDETVPVEIPTKAGQQGTAGRRKAGKRAGRGTGAEADRAVSWQVQNIQNPARGNG
jgi:hypothetical protein